MLNILNCYSLSLHPPPPSTYSYICVGITYIFGKLFKLYTIQPNKRDKRFTQKESTFDTSGASNGCVQTLEWVNSFFPKIDTPKKTSQKGTFLGVSHQQGRVLSQKLGGSVLHLAMIGALEMTPKIRILRFCFRTSYEWTHPSKHDRHRWFAN